MRFKLFLTICIITVAVIYGLPNIILNIKLEGDYTPLTITGNSPIARDEAFAYAPFVNYIQTGHFFVRDVYVSEYSNAPTPFIGESLPSAVFAILSALSGSIEKAFIIGDFIFPPIIFFLTFSLASFFLKNKYYALSVAFFTVLARDFITVIPFPHATFQYLTVAEGQNYLLYLSRAFHPQLTFIFFLAAFISFLKLSLDPSKKIWIIATGLFFGSLFYSYVFYWTYFSLFFLMVSVYSLITKNWKLLRSLFATGVIVFALSFYYLIIIYQFHNLDLYRDFVEKTSLDTLPIPVTLLRYLCLAVTFFLISRKVKPGFYTIFIFILTGIIIGPFSKVLLGQDLETFHYIRRALQPFATIVFMIIIYDLTKRYKNFIGVLSVLIFTTALFLGLRTQIIASEKISQSHILDLDQREVFNWLRNNTSQDSVVGSVNTTFNSLIPVFSNNKTFFPPTDRTIMPSIEGVERYAILSNVLGIDKNWQKKNLDNIVSYLFVYQSYDDQNNLDLNSLRRRQAEEQIESVSKKNLKWEIDKYKLDYIVITPEELSIVHLNLNIVKSITSFDQYIIFKIETR